jgi:phage virion morphogenesis protein
VSGDLSISLVGLVPMRRRLDRLSRRRTAQLLDVIGSEIESQTRRRITDEKRAPDGSAWPSWSPEYAASRPSKGGVLELEGHLLDSITYETKNDAVEVGSNLVYSRRHQEGDGGARGIPRRQYLGLSDENLRDLGDLVVKFLGKELAA